MKIFCVGRNYANHAKELGNQVPTEPIIFSKYSTALLKDNKDFYYPNFSQNIHYELELVYKICKNGKYIDEKFAQNYYNEVTLGIDFTARDLQQKCAQNGKPWEIGKAFDNSAPIGKFVPLDSLATPEEITFSLRKNGEVVQQGNSMDMIFTIDRLISYISTFFTLQTGDLIFTGTPEGVGAVSIGDTLEAYLGDTLLLKTAIK
ncbi:MAG: fumarylacetoacetate hydrolase family protein [Chitinophagales bacterium]|nr:fumarylacetoacetate hydrolase family protein [Chitinophagales bacterium]